MGCRGKYEFICRKHNEYGIQSTFIKNLGRGCCCHYCAFEIKNQYCKDNNIFLIRIPYWDNDDIEYILFDNFVKNNIIKEI